MREAYIKHHATNVWIKFWVPEWYAGPKPPPGAALRDWGNRHT